MNFQHTRPRVSIITPSFNQGRFIERTIRSVLSQEVDGLEYIVVDGGSTDSTLSVLKRYDRRLQWISEPDEGHADAVNKGVSRASAPVIGWLNSDDVYYPGALRAVLGYFDSHPDARVVYGEADHIDEHDRFIEAYPTEAWSFQRLLEVCFISQPSAFMRREVLDLHGPLDKRLKSNDYEYWVRLGKSGETFHHLPRRLAATRLHDACATLADVVRCHRDINDFMSRHLGETPDQWIYNYANAVARSRGVSEERRLLYLGVIVVCSVYASLRWNGRVSRGVIRTITDWLLHKARGILA